MYCATVPTGVGTGSLSSFKPAEMPEGERWFSLILLPSMHIVGLEVSATRLIDLMVSSLSLVSRSQNVAGSLAT